jgi:hypothetical protein
MRGMRLTAVGKFAAGLVACGIVACSGDAPSHVDAGAADAGPADAPASETGVLPSGQPLPPGVPAPRMILGARERLTGLGTTSCSHQQPASGDGHRWCVFMRPPETIGLTELWVIDVTQAASGPVACDGTSPHCRKLTSNLWVDPAVLGGPVHPVSQEFHGDTLIYYADPRSAPGQVHRGPVFAWRPGWTQPRRISSAQAIQCWGHARVPVAHCLEGLSGDPLSPDSVDLRAGPIQDADGITLTPIGGVRARKPSGDRAWLAGFSPAGDRFLVSSPDPDPMVQSLRSIAVADLGRAELQPLLSDAAQWQVSRGGTRLYFQRDESPGKPALFVADYPSGAGVARLAGPVLDYLVLGDPAAPADLGVAVLIEVDARTTAMRLVRDLASPATAPTVFSATGMLEGVQVSPDVRFTAWSDQGFNVRVVRHTDLASCVLNNAASADAFHPAFTDSAGLVFWKETVATSDGDRLDGFLADPDGCQGKRRFGQGVDFLAPVGDRALLFGDELDQTGSTVTLKYALLDGKQWPAGGAVRVQAHVDNASLVQVGDPLMLLLFRVAAGGPVPEGTYLFGPAPF